MAERLKVFDENYMYIGEETRKPSIRKAFGMRPFIAGLWMKLMFSFKKEAPLKKDFPSLYDITAAGHLLADEEIMDGIREVEEELGIEVDPTKMKRMGTVRDVIRLPEFIDKEFANIFLYQSSFAPNGFTLQQEEVESIHAVPITDVQALFRGEVDKIMIENEIPLTLSDFVPHETSYFQAIAEFLDLAKSSGM